MKKFTIFICCLIVNLLFETSYSIAQSPDWIWANTAGGEKLDEGRYLIKDQNGNTYLAGIFNSDSLTFGTATLINEISNIDDWFVSDVFITKYDSNDNFVWSKSFGGNKENVVTGIALNSKGNVYVTGYFNSDSIQFGTTTLQYTGDSTIEFWDYDVFVVEYDKDGNEIWATSIGGNGDQTSSAIAIDSLDNICFTGSFENSIRFQDTILHTGSDNMTYNMFVAKFSSEHEFLWVKSAEGKHDGGGQNIKTDKNGNIYVTGLFYDSIRFGNKFLSAKSDFGDAFFLKYDSSGTVLWAQSIGGTRHDRITSINLATNGSFYITGEFNSKSIDFGAITIKNAGSSIDDLHSFDFFLAKYDSNGILIWVKKNGEYSEDKCNGSFVDTQDNVYITGSFRDPSICFGSTLLTNSTNNNHFEMFIVKYDSSGAVVWAKSAGGNGEDTGIDILSDENDNVFITGAISSSTVDFGQISHNNAGNSDIFIAKLPGSFSSITEENSNNQFIKIYPHSAPGFFHVSGIESGNWKILIYTLDGELIKESAFSDKESNIDLSGHSKGAYIYLLQKDNKVFKTGKLLLE